MSRLDKVMDILRSIRYLNGPIALEVLCPVDIEAPILILMDDMHGGGSRCQYCTTRDGCYSMYSDMSFLEYLNTKVRELELVCDLFIEFWGDSIWQPGYSHQTSALIDTIRAVHMCRPTSVLRSRCPIKDIRVHMVALSKSDGGAESVNPDGIKDPDHPYWKSKGILQKELNKIPADIRRFLISHLVKPAVKPWSYPIHMVSVIDLYATARLLKRPAGSLPVDLNITYLGAMHCRNISNALITGGYYKRVAFYGNDVGVDANIWKALYRQQIGLKRFENKCLAI